MARTANQHIALLSIHPVFAQGIIEGRKTVEFRRRTFGRSVRRVVVYATTPVCKVIGSFEVADMDQGSPRDLWERHGQSGLITRKSFFEYYADALVGVAILIGRVVAAPVPVSVAAITGRKAGPQSYEYVTSESLVEHGLVSWS